MFVRSARAKWSQFNQKLCTNRLLQMQRLNTPAVGPEKSHFTSRQVFFHWIYLPQMIDGIMLRGHYSTRRLDDHSRRKCFQTSHIVWLNLDIVFGSHISQLKYTFWTTPTTPERPFISVSHFRINMSILFSNFMFSHSTYQLLLSTPFCIAWKHLIELWMQNVPTCWLTKSIFAFENEMKIIIISNIDVGWNAVPSAWW